MDFVDWVENVMAATSRAWRTSDAGTKLIGIPTSSILQELGFDVDTRQADFRDSKLAQALRDALRNLEHMGLVEAENERNFKVTTMGSKYAIANLATSWSQIMEAYLEPEQIAFLEKVAELGQEPYDQFVCVKDITGLQVFNSAGWDWEDDGPVECLVLAKPLSDVGMVEQRSYLGGHIDLTPTYVGIVRATTRQIESEFGQLARELLDAWETTNVEFKRELAVERVGGKVNLIRETLGLATTKSSGRRFLIIGFDDKTRQFAVERQR